MSYELFPASDPERDAEYQRKLENIREMVRLFLREAYNEPGQEPSFVLAIGVGSASEGDFIVDGPDWCYAMKVARRLTSVNDEAIDPLPIGRAVGLSWTDAHAQRRRRSS